jgi:hypothetical protein
MTLDAVPAQIEDLQEEAWRLAMYTELERMRLQLAMLTPLEGEVGGRCSNAQSSFCLHCPPNTAIMG